MSSDFRPFFLNKHVLLPLILPLALTACDLFPSSKTPPPKKLQAQYQADDFVAHLSLANLTLAGEPLDLDMAAATHDLEVLQTYTAKPAKHSARKAKEVPQPVAILQCRSQSGTVSHKLAAPLDKKERKLEAMEELVTQMGVKECLIDDIRPATVTVRRDPPMSLVKASPEQAQEAVQARLSLLLATARPLPPLEEAEAQLQMLRFFIDKRQRDAAYIAAENAKQSLAVAEKKPDNEATVKELLGKLEALEKELHRTLPFTL